MVDDCICHDLRLKPTGSWKRASGRAKFKASLEETSTGRPGLSIARLGHQPSLCVFSMHAACETAQGTWQIKPFQETFCLAYIFHHLPSSSPNNALRLPRSDLQIRIIQATMCLRGARPQLQTSCNQWQRFATCHNRALTSIFWNQ